MNSVDRKNVICSDVAEGCELLPLKGVNLRPSYLGVETTQQKYLAIGDGNIPS